MRGALNIMWTATAWEDYIYWQGPGRKCLRHVNQLIKEAQCTPVEDIGKPEPLKANLAGF